MHIVIDDFAPVGLIRALQATWLPESSGHWHCYDNGKRVTKDAARLPTAAKALLAKMAELPIDTILGVTEAFPDLEYLHGAGLHQMPVGGDLGLHTDSQRHPTQGWRREASAVLYVDDVDGGALELCSDRKCTVVERVEAKANRLVVFTTPEQWHRVAECRSIRRGLCLFFWSLRDAGAATTATFA